MAADYAEILSLRLEAEDAAALDQVVARLGSPSRVEAVRECIRRVAAEPGMPADVILHYRGASGVAARLFAQEMHQGPMTVLAALERAPALEARGFTVRAEQVVPRQDAGCRVVSVGDAAIEHCTECGGEDGDHYDDCPVAARAAEED